MGLNRWLSKHTSYRSTVPWLKNRPLLGFVVLIFLALWGLITLPFLIMASALTGIGKPFDKKEARAVLSNEITKLRVRSYASLIKYAEQPESYFVKNAKTGKEYQLEVQGWWDTHPDGDLYIQVSIDDGGVSAFFPVSEGFIIKPDGSFVDE